MLWKGREQSGNVEDRRGSGGRGIMVGGGLGAIVLAVLGLLLGKDPSQLLDGLQGGGAPTEQSAPGPMDDDREFVGVVLKDTEDVWEKLFREGGQQYQKPALVLFRNAVSSGCGNASSASGPFYCPLDGKVYIDMAFNDELRQRFNAPGDFAMAYVIAHEVGHHVQNLLGTSDKVQRLQQQSGEREANRLSVKLELQADFYAGVWAHHAQQMKGILESGDIEEALTAANAIGDDNLQKQSQGYVVPDAFTHGTSQQRVYWFRKGFETGDVDQGNTFDQVQ